MAQKNPADLLRAYLVVGTDELKRKNAVAKLRTYIEPEWQDFCIAELEAINIDEPNELIDSLQALPFGAEIRLVILHGINFLNKDASEALIDYLKDPNPQCVLCCEGETLLKTTRLYKALAKVGPNCVIDCGSLRFWELPPHVIQMAAKLGLTLDANAATELVNRLGENTTALENQLKTFVEIYGSGATITKQTICETVAQVAEIKPWAITDALSERNVAEALRLFNLIPEKEYVRLLIVITGRIRELIGTKALEARPGKANLAAELRINPKMVFKYPKWARNFTQDELVKLLDAAATCDAKLKSTPDKETTFTTFLLQFSK